MLELNEEELRMHLSTLVPEYMIPNIYHKLDVMPLNMNGKIDRVVLKKQI